MATSFSPPQACGRALQGCGREGMGRGRSAEGGLKTAAPPHPRPDSKPVGADTRPRGGSRTRKLWGPACVPPCPHPYAPSQRRRKLAGGGARACSCACGDSRALAGARLSLLRGCSAGAGAGQRGEGAGNAVNWGKCTPIARRSLMCASKRGPSTPSPPGVRPTPRAPASAAGRAPRTGRVTLV